MNSTHELDLNVFFRNCPELEYAIVKFPSDFPRHRVGADIDVFCGDVDAFARALLAAGAPLVGGTHRVEVKRMPQQCYVDYFVSDRLHLRFDLYAAIPEYRRARLKPAFFYSVLDRRQAVMFSSDSRVFPLYRAHEDHELVLRYVEYLEWYELREDKVKHLDYILKGIETDPARMRFVELLHRYTALPPAPSQAEGGGRGTILKWRRSIAFFCGRLKRKGLRGTLEAVGQRLARVAHRPAGN